MNAFVQKHGAAVIGILSGFDRLVFRGTLRQIAFAEGLLRFLNLKHILLKDAGQFFENTSKEVKASVVRYAEKEHRPLIYLPSANTNKGEKALEVAREGRIREGLICVLTTVEACRSFEVNRNREAQRLELRNAQRKCLYAYFYWMHPKMGLMHARLQTWFPFSIQVCLNGREWLARTLDAKQIGYRKSDNCFRWLADCEEAQRCADAQLRTDWPELLNGIARDIHPLYPSILKPLALEYYWSAYQTEWATDVMFKSPERLAEVYPRLSQHAITTFKSTAVMCFLGQKVTATGKIRGNFKGEVVSDLKQRPEGTCVRHRVGQNSVKIYDKQASVLRVETTINNPHAFKVYRPAEGGPEDELDWRQMRKGVADLKRRADVSQACNERYMEAMAKVEVEQVLGDTVQRICRPVVAGKQRYRALHPFGEDAALLAELGRGEYCLNGFRNRDLQAHLFAKPAEATAEKRKRSAHVTRKLRLLRGHGLIKKVPKTHRYQLTDSGRELVVALSAASQASIKQLAALVAA